jgi:glycosyltransferase involved in cell wall biosynthesis
LASANGRTKEPPVGKAKVLLCHDYYHEAGGESQVFESLAKGLKANGHSITTYSRRNADIGRASALGKCTLPFSAFWSPKTWIDVSRLVRDTKPDVAIVQNVLPLMSPSVLTTLDRLGVPVIHAVYNYRLICPSAHLYTNGEICERCINGNYLHCVARKCFRDSRVLSGWYASILWLHRKLGTYSRCVHVHIVPDQFLRQKLASGGIDERRLLVNVNPFSIDGYQPAMTHDGYVLFVGRLNRQKGIMTLLSAMSSGVKSDVKLIVVGQGELESEVVSTIKCGGLADKVTFLGPLWGEEVRKLMMRAAAVVVPSEWYDNLPLILCQANAMGKPVIASRIDGIPEYVENGKNGFLFEPGNTQQLAAAIDLIGRMTDSQYSELSTRARRVAEDVFDFGAHYAVLSGILDTLTRK